MFFFLILQNLFGDLKKEVFRHQDSLEALAELDHLTAPATTILSKFSKNVLTQIICNLTFIFSCLQASQVKLMELTVHVFTSLSRHYLTVC